jgi:hypothetical protein
MTMIAGGDDGTDKAARVLARRPTIRPRPVTPPRTATATTAMSSTPATPAPRAWRLPPVRLPSPRITARAQAGAATRPVLLLVADASDQFEIALRHDAGAGEGRRMWRAPRIIALAAASVVVLAAAVVLVVWASARPSEQLATSAVSARAATIATAATALPAAKAAEPAAPEIPLVDVKSLPPAPRRR